MRGFLLPLFAGVLAAVPVVEALAQSGVVGRIELISVWGYGKPPETNDWRDAHVRDPVYFNQGLRTPEDGALHTRFQDDTVMRLGSNAEVIVDDYVYDYKTLDGKFVAEMTKGAFRFVTGRMRKAGVQLGTPTAIIGVRGTDFIVVVGGNGSTTVSVLEGEVEITPRAGGGTEVVSVGQVASVGVGATDVSFGGSPPSADPGLDENAGGDASDSGSDGGGGDGGGGH